MSSNSTLTAPATSAPATNSSAPLGLPALTNASPAGLAGLARVLATRTSIWQPLVRQDPDERYYTRLAGGEGWEAWLLGWWPGQSTGLHDHGDSAGAFVLLEGTLDETSLAGRPRIGAAAGLRTRTLQVGDVRSFGPDYVHDVTNNGPVPAVSLHVYGPALSRMTRYGLDDAHVLQVATRERAGADW